MKRTFMLFAMMMISLFANAQIIQFADPKFKDALVNTLCVDTGNDDKGEFDADENNDGEIEVSEAINIHSLTFKMKDFNSIQGIENFENLTRLRCYSTNLTSIDITKLPKLITLEINNNQITEIISDYTPHLRQLSCNYNLLSELPLEKFPNLGSLSCSGNNFLELNISQNLHLFSLVCQFSPLEVLLAKSDSIYNFIHWGFDTNLKYICTDEENILSFKNIVPWAEVNSYCSFNPSGKYFTIIGQKKIDLFQNGCIESNSIIPLRFYINSEHSAGSISFNSSSFYEISVLEGTHTIKPILENPDYYDISPDSISITFPSTSDTFIQDFCITPKGIHRQVDLSIIPLTPPARSGFDASYKVVMTNKGNQIENGTLYFAYDEARMDFVSTDVNPTTQSDGLLSWNFTDLLPFETRYYNVTLNVNSPSETPPVNAGDELLITCNILDNVFLLKQEVVGSYDPNDKTCLEGKTITPEQVGEYVHYLIRFENTGNYAAENVVVKDVIDESTFDISTLQITDASHEAWARFNGNVVEFIFENIQLPVDDATNDGYICFKIKTKPTLVLGNELKNEANIYFDYNLPILTNKTNTVVALPTSTDEENREGEIEIFPNPVTDVLKFSADMKIIKVEIYDMIGRLVQVSNGNTVELNIENLMPGKFTLKVHQQDVIRTSSFIKIKM